MLGYESESEYPDNIRGTYCRVLDNNRLPKHCMLGAQNKLRQGYTPWVKVLAVWGIGSRRAESLYPKHELFRCMHVYRTK